MLYIQFHYMHYIFYAIQVYYVQSNPSILLTKIEKFTFQTQTHTHIHTDSICYVRIYSLKGII